MLVWVKNKNNGDIIIVNIDQIIYIDGNYIKLSDGGIIEIKYEDRVAIIEAFEKRGDKL